MRVAAMIFLALLLASLCASQDKPAPRAALSSTKSAAEVPTTVTGPKLTKEQQLRATKLLQYAETGAATLDPASRIIAYTDLARNYASREKAKALDLLDTALDSCRDLQLDSTSDGGSQEIKSNLERRVMQEIVNLSPERLDARVFDLSPDMRKTAADLLVDYYTSHKLFDRGYDVVMRVAGDGEMPYGTAIHLMHALKDRPDQVRSLFVSSLTSYENGGGQKGFQMMGDFPEMIVDFHDQLPNQVVMRAIDAVLDAAKAHDESNQQKMNYSMSSEKGAIQFHSTYEFRLFQLAPILKQIDPAREELLLKDQQQVNTQLGKYPQGTNSLLNGEKHPYVGVNMQMTGDGGSKPGEGYNGPSPIEMQRFEQIQANSHKHPQDALAEAATLKPFLAMMVYQTVASNNVTSDTAVAKSALSKLQDLMEKNSDDNDQFRFKNFEDVADIYRRMGDTDSAKKMIEKGLNYAGRLYKKDTDAGDPNVAPKAYWPSTKIYRSLLQQAQKLDPVWAVSLLDGIPDDSIRVFLQITVAEAILGTQKMPFMTVMYSPKSGNGSFFMMGPN